MNALTDLIDNFQSSLANEWANRLALDAASRNEIESFKRHRKM